MSTPPAAGLGQNLVAEGVVAHGGEQRGGHAQARQVLGDVAGDAANRETDVAGVGRCRHSGGERAAL